jgi:GrpB-like predicted nucleotidyltransferase (UPF0157 family)
VGEPDDDLDRRLDAVLIGGREPRSVEIVGYDHAWPLRFEQEQDRIRAAIGTCARRIAHIGSTSVPGLAAKPIIDIMVTVDEVDDESTYRPALEEAGYVLRVREPGHRMFRTAARDVHLHVWPSGGEDGERHLIFRYWLRSHPGEREEYAALKRSLAGHWPDVNSYAQAKSGLIDRIMADAKRYGGGREIPAEAIIDAAHAERFGEPRR